MDVGASPAQAKRVAQIQSVSPSRATALLACPLSECLRAGNAMPRIATHPKAHFGTVAHYLINQSSKGRYGILDLNAARRIWSAYLQEYETRLSENQVEACVIPLARSCEDYEVEAILVAKKVASVSRGPIGNSVGSETGSGYEVSLRDRDRLITGRADKVYWSDGAPIITDLKTGRLTETGGQIREEYLVQIKLYAYLVHDLTGHWAQRLILQDLHGAEITVEYSRGEVLRVAEKVKTKLFQVNDEAAKILRGESSEEALATPNTKACRFCVFRISCAAYWSQRPATGDKGWPVDLKGRIAAIKPAGEKHLVLEVGTSDGLMIVRGPKNVLFNRAEEKALETSQSIRICELKAERAPHSFSCKPITRVVQAD